MKGKYIVHWDVGKAFAKTETVPLNNCNHWGTFQHKSSEDLTKELNLHPRLSKLRIYSTQSAFKMSSVV